MRLHLYIALMLLWLASSPVAVAQELAPAAGADSTTLAQFLPLDIGNEWVYVYREPWHSSEVKRYYRYVVAGDTMIHDTLFYNIRTSEYGGDFGLKGEWQRLVRRDSVGRMVTRKKSSPEWILSPVMTTPFASSDYPYLDTISIRSDTTVLIGDREHVAPELRTSVFHGWYSQYDRRVHVKNVGLLEVERVDGLTSNGRPLQHLVYAVVSNGTYGQRVIPTQHEVPAVPGRNGLEITAFPTPASSRVTLRYNLPATQATMLNIYDILGRHVGAVPTSNIAAGMQQMDLSVEDMVPGTYYARISDANGNAASTAFVVVR